MSTQHHFDVLIIGTGSAGLMSALQLSDDLSIALIAKDKILEGSSYYAQGGISAVLDNQDNFESHIADTLSTGVDLGNETAVRFMVEQAPSAVKSLEQAGVVFTQQQGQYHLTTEGGHSNRRVAHVADKTGQSIQTNLLDSVKSKKNITLFENFIAIDLLTQNQHCYGAYVLNKSNNEVESFIATRPLLPPVALQNLIFTPLIRTLQLVMVSLWLIEVVVILQIWNLPNSTPLVFTTHMLNHF